MSVLLSGSGVLEAVQPALTTLEKSVIGAVLIVALGLMVTAVVAMIRIQNARVADQKEASIRLESTHTKMVDAFGNFKITIETLSRAEDTTQQGLQALSREVTALSGKVDLMIAMRGQRGSGG